MNGRSVLKSFLLFVALLVGSISFSDVGHAQEQPCQWSYKNIGGVATAVYCGNVNVNGTVNAQIKSTDCLVATVFGADPTGTNDSVPAWNAMIAQIGTGNNCIDWGVGNYKFSTAISATLTGSQALVIKSGGPGTTSLNFPNVSGGISFTLATTTASFTLQNLKIVTGQVNQSIGFTCSGQGDGLGDAPNYVNNVLLSGNDGIKQTNFWKNGIKISDCSNINISGGGIYGSSASANGGSGIVVAGANSQYSTQINIVDYVIGGIATPIQLGSFWQGVSIVNTNITNCQNGIFETASQTGILSGIQIVNSNIACDVDDIVFASSINGVQINGNFLQAAIVGTSLINSGQTGNTVIVGNIFLGDGGNDIAINNTVANAYVNIADNVLVNGSAGIDITSTASNAFVHGNRIFGAGTSIVNAGINSVISDNPGYNPTGSAGIAISASPFTYASGASTEIDYFASTATINSVTLNGISILPIGVGASVPVSFLVPPNSSLVITYTGTLTGIKSVQ